MRNLIKVKTSSAKFLQFIYYTFFVFCVLVLGIVIVMNLKSNNDSEEILKKSIQSQLISISAAAREIIDVNAFETYNQRADIDNNDAYRQTLSDLRILATNSGAKYIYALKKIDDQYYFIFDTDMENDTAFTTYEPFPVHMQAFLGKPSADIMNVQDEFGSFSTGAVPILKDNRVIGIISADIEDLLITENMEIARRNSLVLILILFVTLSIMSIAIILALKRIKTMQDKLEHLANYDKLTGLPNRQYLLEHLAVITSQRNKKPFALLFVDLDNFKQVNDNAGHDAGDALLRNIGYYLENAQESSKAFRPTAGALNVAARIGGDEFILVVPGIHTVEDAETFASELLNNFSQTNSEIDKYIAKYKVGLSIGVALFPYHTEDFHVLIKYADISMYHAKRAGKNGYMLYNEDMKPKDEK